MKRLLLFLILALSSHGQILSGILAGSSSVVLTPVAFNNTNTMVQTAGTSFSGAMSVTAGGTNTTAFAIVGFDQQATGAITSVTYGGQTMTLACGPAFNATSNARVSIYYLAAPPTGSNTLAVTGNANINELYVNLVSFNNVNQTTPVRPATCATATGNSTSPQLVITSDATNDITITALDSGGGGVSSTNQTSTGISNGGSFGAGGDRGTARGATVTHTWTQGSSNWALVGFSIQP